MAAPNAAGPGSPGSGQRTAGRGEISKAQARRWLRYYGYGDALNLHVSTSIGMRIGRLKTKNGRRVKVVLDDRGTATEQK